MWLPSGRPSWAPKVTLVEREHIGGTCLNIGCIPTKCLLHSAELVSEIKEQGADIGVKVSGVEVDFPQVIAHKNAISKQLTQGVAGLLKQNKVARVDGEASFTGPKTLSVKKSDGSVEEMTADAIIVATGSVNAQPPIPGLKENPNCIDSTGALSLEKLPKSMVVIGGGVIGLELACAYAAFGTKITVVEALDHMLPMLDGDLTAIGVKHMKKMGMEFNLECPVQAVEASPVGAKVVCKNKAGETVSFEAEKVLVAIGRKANTASLNLEGCRPCQRPGPDHRQRQDGDQRARRVRHRRLCLRQGPAGPHRQRHGRSGCGEHHGDPCRV